VVPLSLLFCTEMLFLCCSVSYFLHVVDIFPELFLLAYVVLPSRLCGIIFHPVKLSFVCVLLSENVGMVARSGREINGTWTRRCRL